jgi:hypothetical protein
LAIKFPGKDDHSDTSEERDDAIRRLDPVMKPSGSVANGPASRGPLSMSSLSRGRKEEEFRGSKKRQSPSETFEPWSDVREPVKKSPRTEVDGCSIGGPHTTSSLIARGAATASANGETRSKKSQPVYASSSGGRRDVYGADSVERGGIVLSSATKGGTGKATHQVREISLKTDDATVKTDDATVKSVSAGMKNLALHGKSDTERKSSSTATKSKPHSISSGTSSAPKTKSLQDSKFQITGTKVGGTNSSPHSNATRTTGTAGTKSVGGNNSKLHSTTSGFKSHSKPSLGTSITNKPTVAASSARGRGGERGRGQSSGRGTVLRQSSTGSSGSPVSKVRGHRGKGGGSTHHRTSGDKI